MDTFFRLDTLLFRGFILIVAAFMFMFDMIELAIMHVVLMFTHAYYRSRLAMNSFKIFLYS